MHLTEIRLGANACPEETKERGCDPSKGTFLMTAEGLATEAMCSPCCWRAKPKVPSFWSSLAGSIPKLGDSRE